MTPVVPAPIDALREQLAQHLSRGFHLVHYAAKTKEPSGREATGWNTDSSKWITTVEQLNALPDTIIQGNWGVLTGVAVASNKFLVDVDFDYPGGKEAIAVFLVNTGFAFGRGGRVTHALYTMPQPFTTETFIDPIDKKHLVQLRGLTRKGTPCQSMIPPSIHPDGDILEHSANGPIAHAADIRDRIARYATYCLLHKHFGHREITHDVRLAIAGFLLKDCHLNEDDVTSILLLLVKATGNDVKDVAGPVRTTADKIRNNEPVAGREVIIEALDKGDRIVTRIQKWLVGQANGTNLRGFSTNPRGEIVANSQANILYALELLDIELSYDAFAQKPMVSRDGGALEYMDDHLRNNMWLDIRKQFRFRPPNEDFDIVIKTHARNNSYHPVKQYLASLTWDGIERLDTWLIEYGGAADNDYVRAIGRIVLVAAVRRIMRPGCKFDELLVLESKQGQFKSTALRALCPQDEWFSDDLPLNVDSKQVIERTGGKWLIEASELSGYQRSRIEHLKSFLSRQVDGPVRLAYDRLPTVGRRQFIIVGTTNAEIYLKDTTGNRRFWPVKVGKFNIEKLLSDRDQLWAEAAHREASGESIRLSPHLYNAAAKQQNRRRVLDPWEPYIAKLVEDQDVEYRLTPEDIWATLDVFHISQVTPAEQERVNAIMYSLGFEYVKKLRSKEGTIGRKDDKTIRRWHRMPLNSDGTFPEIDDEDED